jgi:hypothetical protein
MSKARGFGVPVKDGKAQIIKKKRPDLFESDQAADALNHGYFGNDSVDPEANTVPTGTVPTATPAPTQQVDSNTGLIQISQDELNRLIDQRSTANAHSMNQSLMDQMTALRDAADDRARQDTEEKQRLIDEAATAKAEADRMKSIFNATGNSIPTGADNGRSRNYSFAVNTLILPSSTEPKGAAKDFVDMFNNRGYTPVVNAYDPKDGEAYEQRDTSYLDRWLRDSNNRKHAITDMEQLFKAHGMLRGGDMGRDNQSGPTLGTSGSIQDAFLPFLSALMRTSHVARYIWHQFSTTRLELGRVAGNNILVPRFQWLDEPTDEDDYILDSATTAATISNESQALQSLTSPIELFGYGLGKGNKIGNRPIAIPEFVLASSMMDLLQALDSRLGQNYNAFEDLKIRRIFQLTLANSNNIYYNQGGSLTQTPASIQVGEDGTCTEEALNSMFGEMTRRGIPTYDNGSRVGVLNTYAATQLKNSLGDKLRGSSEAEIQEVTNILNAGSLGDGIVKPSGYLGTYCNFMLFESGTIGVGAVGTQGSEGVQDTIFGAGTRVTRDNFFFGPGVVGQGQSLPMEIRMDEAGTFGTKMRFIWRSIEGWGALDCSSTLPGQQDRVLVLRNADQVI